MDKRVLLKVRGPASSRVANYIFEQLRSGRHIDPLADSCIALSEDGNHIKDIKLLCDGK